MDVMDVAASGERAATRASAPQKAWAPRSYSMLNAGVGSELAV